MEINFSYACDLFRLVSSLLLSRGYDVAGDRYLFAASPSLKIKLQAFCGCVLMCVCVCKCQRGEPGKKELHFLNYGNSCFRNFFQPQGIRNFTALGGLPLLELTHLEWGCHISLLVTFIPKVSFSRGTCAAQKRKAWRKAHFETRSGCNYREGIWKPTDNHVISLGIFAFYISFFPPQWILEISRHSTRFPVSAKPSGLLINSPCAPDRIMHHGRW